MQKHRLPGLMALLTLGCTLLAVGCSTTKKANDEPACGGEACGGSACGSETCGGETAGDKLEERFAETWDVAVTLSGDAEAGRKFFNEEGFDEGMPCAACHAFDKADTMTTDAGDHQRAAVSVYAARWRTNIKNTGSHNSTLGGDVCVPYWQGGPKEGAGAQQLADLDAFFKAESGPKDHATAVNIDWKGRTFTIPETLTGGDAARGEKQAVRYCGTCHEVNDAEPLYDVGVRHLKGGTVATDRLDRLAKRIKDKGKSNNDFMPGFNDQRMPEQDLLDILAFFEKK
ncbi:MAG: c-type cytochrome [Planctomycetes bacterium]|nr:c-type cytochrome [Planctomycetota bacterium]